MKKSIKTHTRLVTCLIALAVVFATFLAGTFTTQASTDVFGDIELKVGDTLGFVYYTSQPYTKNTKMRFTINGRTSESIAYPNDGKCVFIFNDIYPHELAQEVTATIVVDGTETVSSTGLSIKSFLLKMLMDPNTSEDEKNFASDTLQYGEQTRLYRNANVDVADMDSVSITEDINKTIYTKYDPQDIDAVMVGSAMGLGVSASNIRLSSIGIAYHNTNYYVVTLQVPTNSNVDLSKIKVQIGDDTFTHQDFTYKANGQYEIKSKPINAYDIMNDKNATKTFFKLFVNGTSVQEAQYSVLDYIYQLQDAAQDNSLALKYARSLYRYGQSAEKAYKGNRVISVALQKNPGDENGQMKPKSTKAQTPEGGAIIAYYSDGTSAEIVEGIKWDNVDIYNNPVAIVDDTYEKKFTVRGTYADDITGKKFTVTGTVKLVNVLERVERYTDPDVLDTKSDGYVFADEYTPTGGQVKCTWSNQYTSYRSPSYPTIQMDDYECDEYGFIPVTASYTDRKSNTTKTVTTYLLYKNPIKSITIEDTTATFNDNKLPENTTTPTTPKYIVTYSNDSSIEKKSLTWSNVITSEDNSQELTYSLSLGNLQSNKCDIIIEGNVNGVLTGTAHDPWERMEDGSKKVYTDAPTSITGTCKVTATNGEKALQITTAPSVYGGTITSKNNLTGKPNSNIKGQLTGGTVEMTYYNGASENVTNNGITYSTSDTITDTAYSKSVAVTASYKGKDGKTYTGTKNTTIYNWMKSISQDHNAVVYAATHSNKTKNVTTSDLKDTIKVTYYNTVTQVCGDTASIAVSLNGVTRTDFYIANITDATIADAVRTNASASSSGTPAYTIVVTYTDTRAGANYDINQRTQKIEGYKVAVRNTAKSFVADQRTQVYKLQNKESKDTPFTPNDQLSVNLTNGKTTQITPTYTAVMPIQYSAIEIYERESTVTYTPSNGDKITGTAWVRVSNPITSVVLYSDPNNITVTTKTAITKSLLTGCQLTATYTNGQTKVIDANSYGDLSAVLISDHTRIKQCTIQVGYSSDYSHPQQVAAKVILLNPITKTELKLSTFASGTNRGWITANGGTPSGKMKITFSNTYSYEYTPTTIDKLYKTGTTSSNGNAASTPTGECSIKGTYNIAATGTYYRYISGKASTNATKYDAETKTASATAYWKNKPISATVKSCSVTVADKSKTQVTPVMELNVTWETGGTSVQNAECQGVPNITDTTTSKDVTCTGSYTANEISVKASKDVKLRNPVKSYTVENIYEHFYGSTKWSAQVTGKATYTNNAEASRNANSVSPKDTFTPDKGKLSVEHTEASCKTFKTTCTAQYTDENGTSTSPSFSVTVINQTHSLTTSARTKYSSSYDDISDYAQFGYFNGTTAISHVKGLGNFTLKYENGKTKTRSYTQVKFTSNNTTFDKTTKFLHGDSWSQSQLREYTVRYPLDDKSLTNDNGETGTSPVTCTFVATPQAYYTTTTVSAKHTKAKHTGDNTYTISPSDLKITYSKLTKFQSSNGKSRTATSTDNTVNAISWTYGGTNTYKDTALERANQCAFGSFTQQTQSVSKILSGDFEYTFLKCNAKVDNHSLFAMFPHPDANTSTSTVWTSLTTTTADFNTEYKQLSQTTGTKPF